MTNLLHRQGEIEFLKKDFLIKNKTTKKFDDTTPEIKQQTIEKTRELIRILWKHKPDNIGQGRVGCMAAGVSVDKLLQGVENAGSLSSSVFRDISKVKKILQELKERNLGQSITVSGLIEEVFDVCQQIGQEPHSILLSLGIWGKKEELPTDKVLSVTTMCGHGCVSRRLVENMIQKVDSGKTTVTEAAKTIARPCSCGAVNVTSVADMFAKKPISNLNLTSN
jgi:hypothetical protein